MSLWLLFFASFMSVFGTVVLVWWRFETEKRRQHFTLGVAADVKPEGDTPEAVVLKPPPEARKFAARWLTASNSGEDSGEKHGWSRGGFFLLTGVMLASGAMLGWRLTGVIGPSAPFILGAAMGVVPWRLRERRRKGWLRKIEEEFPDALDFLSRTVRAGNALSVGLELLAAETPEPMKAEMVRVTRELALGAPMEDALNGLLHRIPLFEVRFFVAAVLLQRETGGNLSEVLSKLAGSVRERLRLRDRVKAASGQGRLTAMVLTVLPLATLSMIELVSPQYIGSLTSDPVGQNLMAAAVLAQVIGYLLMKKICNIEV
jgi:tight adherence protein B